MNINVAPSSLTQSMPAWADMVIHSGVRVSTVAVLVAATIHTVRDIWLNRRSTWRDVELGHQKNDRVAEVARLAALRDIVTAALGAGVPVADVVAAVAPTLARAPAPPDGDGARESPDAICVDRPGQVDD